MVVTGFFAQCEFTADCNIRPWYWSSVLYSLISSGENSAFDHFAAAIANHYNLALSFRQVPITAGWTDALWYGSNVLCWIFSMDIKVNFLIKCLQTLTIDRIGFLVTKSLFWWPRGFAHWYNIHSHTGVPCSLNLSWVAAGLIWAAALLRNSIDCHMGLMLWCTRCCGSGGGGGTEQRSMIVVLCYQ